MVRGYGSRTLVFGDHTATHTLLPLLITQRPHHCEQVFTSAVEHTLAELMSLQVSPKKQFHISQLKRGTSTCVDLQTQHT